MLSSHYIKSEVSDLNYHVLATFNDYVEREEYLRELKTDCDINHKLCYTYDFKVTKIRFDPIDLDTVLERFREANLLIVFYSFFLGQALEASNLGDIEPTPSSTNEIISCLCESSLGQSSIDALVDRVAVINMLLKAGQVNDNYWAPIINIILMLLNVSQSTRSETVIAIENTETLEVIFPKCWRRLEIAVLKKKSLKLAIHKMITHNNAEGYSNYFDGITPDKTRSLEVELTVRQCVDSWLVTTYIPYDTTPAIVDLILFGRFKKRYEKKSHLHAVQIAKLGSRGVMALEKIIEYHKSPAVASELNKLAVKVSNLAYSDSCLA